MKKQYVCALIPILLWSTTTVTTKLLLTNMTTMQMLCWKSLLGGCALLLYTAFTGRLRKLAAFSPGELIRCGGIGLLGPFLSTLCLYKGTEYLLGQEVTIINYLWPILSVLAGCVFLRERLTPRKAAALLISFLGAVCVITRGSIFTFHPASVRGVVITVLAAAFYGIHVALAKKYNYDGFLLMLLASLLAFLLSGCYLIATDSLYLPALPEFLGLCWLGVFLSAVAYSLWTTAFELGDSAAIANLAYISPFLSLLFIRIFLKEEISPYSILGLAIIVAGILLQSLSVKKLLSEHSG